MPKLVSVQEQLMSINVFCMLLVHKKFFGKISIDEIIKVDSECSQWRNRDDMWVNMK